LVVRAFFLFLFYFLFIFFFRCLLWLLLSSIMADIVAKKRSRLQPECVDALLFLAHNWQKSKELLEQWLF
jgi:hypothetical protein